MAFSSLYSSVLRGKWFISFKDVEANHILVNKLLERGVDSEDTTKLSEKTPITVSAISEKEMKSGNDFTDAPQDSVAIIGLQGSMIKYGSYCSYGTTEVAELINKAADSPKITGILLDIDSGGGSVDSIAPLVDAIQYAQKKKKCVIAYCDLCASAAYYVACYCDEIVASNTISSEFGSIGVMMGFQDYAKYYENAGIKTHTIYSDLSNYKNAPFESAKEGNYDAIKTEELNPLARGFQEAVKSKRGDKLNLKVEGIIAGRMFYANEAKTNGLIDSIGTRDFAVNRVREIRRDACLTDYINSKNA
ncbi:MAG: S49 family peptidase [Bacteroides sp.]|uniref:S49 family peptidase n=1 Tax=Bacteroides sp. TaxID=29523 RepID=UPI002FCA0B4D